MYFRGEMLGKKIGSHKQESELILTKRQVLRVTLNGEGSIPHDKTLLPKSFHKVNTKPNPIPYNHIF